jgi:hypothetical protein
VDQIKFGVHIPVMEFDGKRHAKEEIISFAQYAEALGYDSLSVNDHIVFHTSWLDAISTLSAIAASTIHILIGTSILNIVVRNPVVCAKALAAIDILSSGRLFEVSDQGRIVEIMTHAELILARDGQGSQKHWRYSSPC